MHARNVDDRCRSSRFVLSAAATAAGLGLALNVPAMATDMPFQVSLIVQEGDPMPNDDGTIGNINDISINNNGDWIVDVGVSGGSVNRALLRNGDVWIKPGDPIDPNDTVTSVATLLKHQNNHGDVTLRLGLDVNDSGIYVNESPVLLEDQISTAPQFSSDTPYIGFFRSRINDDGDVWAIVTANDSELPGSVHRAMLHLQFDDRTGTWTENVIAARHFPAPGTEEGVTFDQLESDASRFAVNNSGDVIFSSGFNNAPSGTDGGLYVNDSLQVRKGDPSPVAGSNYANIGSSGTRVDINDLGDFIFMSTLTDQPTATNTIIARNNIFTDGPDELVIQRGDPAPGLPGRTIDSLGTGAQPHIANDGAVFWYARFDGDSDTNQGLYRHNQLLLQKGVTSIDGNLITTVAGTTGLSNGITQSMVASDDGRFVLVRVQFEDGSRGAVLIDFCEDGDLNCDGEVNVLDLLLLLESWGLCADCDRCPADLNGDCVVNVLDLLILLENWG